MTSPKYAKSTARGRHYINPVTQQTYPSVTTILGQIGKAEALKWWAAAETAKYAVNNKDTWLALDQDAAIDLLKREPLRSLSRAADRGTDVHAIADRYATLGYISDLATHNGYVTAMLRFFADHQPQPILAEKTVFSEMGYAGSFDMVCKLPALGDVLCILDYKTSKAIYPDTAAQLAAYAHAENYLTDDDQLTPMLKVEAGVVVRFGADGEYQVAHADLDAGWQLFKGALEVFKAQQNKLLIAEYIEPTAETKQAVADNNTATRANITERVKQIQPNDALYSQLRGRWIPNLPPLSSDQPIHRHQLEILNQLVLDIEKETNAPFNPPPSLKPTKKETPKTATPEPLPSDDITVADSEVQIIRQALNESSSEVRQAVKLTTQEASAAKTTLSLQGKPTLRRAFIARLMIECYTEDPTRDYMCAILNYLRVFDTNIGKTLGKLTIQQVEQIEQTMAQVNEGKLALTTDNQNQYTLKETK